MAYLQPLIQLALVEYQAGATLWSYHVVANSGNQGSWKQLLMASELPYFMTFSGPLFCVRSKHFGLRGLPCSRDGISWAWTCIKRRQSPHRDLRLGFRSISKSQFILGFQGPEAASSTRELRRRFRRRAVQQSHHPSYFMHLQLPNIIYLPKPILQ